jgi:hypothetical protein
LLAIAPSFARADYVCEVELMGATQTNLGDYGYIKFTTTPSPGCTGALSSYWICTNKAGGVFPTYTGCATSLLSRHSVESLPILFSEIARAARDAQSIKVGKGPCQSNGGANCAIAVTFQGF